MAGSIGGGVTLDELSADAVAYDNTVSGLIAVEVQAAIDEINTKANAAIYPIQLIYNGNLSSDTFLSYSNLAPNTPMIVPINSEFVGFTFSNSKTNNDYTLNFRNNTNAGTPFYTISKLNTQSFAQSLPSPETFAAGDFISVEYVDDGQNSNDVVMMLNFRGL